MSWLQAEQHACVVHRNSMLENIEKLEMGIFRNVKKLGEI
jgi:hypothetical protein